jgi:hypothetical protein
MPVHAPDGHGGFYMLSANSRRSGHPIENVLNGHQDRIVPVMELCSEATALLGNWTSMGSVASQLFLSVFKKLTDAVQARDTSFYHIRLLSPVLIKSVLHARRVANEIVSNVSSDEQERTAACNALNTDDVLGMGVTTHSCSCAQVYNYNACKHVLWATMKTTGQLPPLNVDPWPADVGLAVLARRVARWTLSQMPRIPCSSPYVTWTVVCRYPSTHTNFTQFLG